MSQPADIQAPERHVATISVDARGETVLPAGPVIVPPHPLSGLSALYMRCTCAPIPDSGMHHPGQALGTTSAGPALTHSLPTSLLPPIAADPSA
jgi:hypothetical protein